MTFSDFLLRSKNQKLDHEEISKILNKTECNIENNKKFVSEYQNLQKKLNEATLEFNNYSKQLHDLNKIELTKKENQTYNSLEEKMITLDNKLEIMKSNYYMLQLACMKKGKKIQIRNLDKK